MVNGDEGLYEVNEDDEGCKVVLWAELDSDFEGGDGVRATFALEAAAFFLHTIISDVGVHTVCDDCSKDFVGDVEESAGALVVRVGCFTFQFKDWAEGAESPFFWDRSTLPDGSERFEDETMGRVWGLLKSSMDTPKDNTFSAPIGKSFLPEAL